MTERALADLRVVDISQGIAGPYATKLLADSGALVTKVEPPAGDYSRRLGPFPGDVPDPEKSGLYLHLNTSKRSITLDVSVHVRPGRAEEAARQRRRVRLRREGIDAARRGACRTTT